MLNRNLGGLTSCTALSGSTDQDLPNGPPSQISSTCCGWRGLQNAGHWQPPLLDHLDMASIIATRTRVSSWAACIAMMVTPYAVYVGRDFSGCPSLSVPYAYLKSCVRPLRPMLSRAIVRLPPRHIQKSLSFMKRGSSAASATNRVSTRNV